MRTLRTTLRVITIRRLLTAACALIVIWVAATYVTGALMVSDGLCAESCHSMRAFDAASESTVHAALACVDCHAASGVLGPLADGLALQRRLIVTTRRFESATLPSSDASCRRCHPAVAAATVVSQGIAVRHEDFAAESCMTCHGGIGHPIPGRAYEVAEMADCMTCHSSSARETQACDLCHIPDSDREKLRHSTTWRVTHGPSWQKTHGMGDMRTCVSCHAPAYCARCHGVALPHPETWPREHGDTLADGSSKACEACHDRAWCNECHGIEMPHASGFLPVHGATADEQPQGTCRRCHLQEACDECHYRSAHPDIPGAAHFHEGEDGS